MVAWDDTSACSSSGELSYPPQGLQKNEEEVEEEEIEEEEDDMEDYEDYSSVSEEASGGRVRRGASKKSRGKKTCKLRSMYVNFKEIGWNSWIIAPTGESYNNPRTYPSVTSLTLNISVKEA